MKKGILIASFLFSSGLYAQDVDSLLNNLHSLQANFSQTIAIAQQTPQKSTGIVYIKEPNQFRWQVQSPNPQLFVSDGQKLWNDEQDLDQVTVHPLDKSLSATPLLLLSGRVADIRWIEGA